MKLFKRKPRPGGARKGSYDETPHVLDHVPLGASGDWRKERLAEAAQKHGKPFKCAGQDMPREVIVCSKGVVLPASTREGGK
jgi:hypothetical protein